jgi:hypothetical protein
MREGKSLERSLKEEVMKAGKILLISAALLFLIPFAAKAQEKYVPTANEEFYGVWMCRENPDYNHPQKSVITADGYKSFLHTPDTASQEEGTMVIDSKWTDSGGNIWYKILGTVTTGQWKGYNFQALEKLTNSGTIKESVFQPIGLGTKFSPKYYPLTIDPSKPTYEIRYREGS